MGKLGLIAGGGSQIMQYENMETMDFYQEKFGL